MMRTLGRAPILAWIFVISLLPAMLSAEDLEISAKVMDKNTIQIDFKTPVEFKDTQLILYRSTAKMTSSDIDKVRYPITEFIIDARQNPITFVDHFVAHNVTYYYLAAIEPQRQNHNVATSNMVEISVPNVRIEQLIDPIVLIDKTNYYLEIQDNGKALKRYPISLGRDPIKRKIHQDNKTTPEGIYKIINLQKQATFYKAIDIDYPNALDRIRYDFMRSEGLIPQDRGIGGEIQVHGKHPRFGSIQRNWTWGCISLRNTDMDELFGLPALKVGVPVIIFGQELSKKDAISLNGERTSDEIESTQKKLTELGLYKGKIDGILGRRTQFAIGRYQKVRGLPITCFLDSRTVDLLFNSPADQSLL